jgi:SAM-dependent methyltransferase
MRPAASGGTREVAAGEAALQPVKPALSYRFLTRFYDPLVRWTTSERAFRGILLEQVAAAAARGSRLLDVGCGTGTFALELARRRTDLAVVGFDADATALTMAHRKGERVRSSTRWELGRAERLPFAEATFDAVTSSLFFHHLRTPSKVDVAREIHRVLAPGGTLFVADWTAPSRWRTSIAFRLVELLDGFATTRDHRAGRLGALLGKGGFAAVEATASLDVPLGTIGFWRARRSAEPADGERDLAPIPSTQEATRGDEHASN